MKLGALVFYGLAAITAVSSLGVVIARRVLHAALALVGALLGAAGIFVLYGAEFVGLVQILVYVGAVVVLFLFGIMLTSTGTRTEVNNKQQLTAGIAAAAIFGVLAIGIISAFGGTELKLTRAFPTEAIGQEIFTNWIVPFEAVSFLLLAALVGSIVLARRD